MILCPNTNSFGLTGYWLKLLNYPPPPVIDFEIEDDAVTDDETPE